MGKDLRHKKKRDPYAKIRRPTPPPPIFFKTEKEKIRDAKRVSTRFILDEFDVDEDNICENCKENETSAGNLLCFECLK